MASILGCSFDLKVHRILLKVGLGWLVGCYQLLSHRFRCKKKPRAKLPACSNDRRPGFRTVWTHELN